ncbi:MAG TPA: formate dehydrogenase subunit gamma [Myxococcaceae bacterium]|nr:formate dehydrogenase subunit gamma [Myxococcaceae bacterium]
MTSPRSVPAGFSGDLATAAAATQEDIVVGGRLVRFRWTTRALHWSVALTFVLTLFTGLPIWSPIFGWLAYLFGGLQVARWLHPWLGIAFSVFILLQFIDWAREMRMTPADKRFVRLGNFLAYMRWESHDAETGKYNGGQKLLFWLSTLAALGLLLTGVVLWFPQLFGEPVRQWSWLLHDVTFILFTLLIIGHIYLGIVEPGTFTGMIRGTVSRDWARLNHPGWYREVTEGKAAGDDPTRVR